MGVIAFAYWIKSYMALKKLCGSDFLSLQRF